MLWFYIAGLVVIVGAEINAVLERHAGSGEWEKRELLDPTDARGAHV